MYEILYRYLIKHKKLDLPGIGVLVLQVSPVEAGFVDHSFSPPKYNFELERTENVPPEKLFSWLATQLGVTEQEAVIRFNDFLFDINRQLREGKQIQWPRVGSLQKEFSGEIKFSAHATEFPWLGKITAEKITRKNAEHTMLVGEKEKTSSQMRELLSLAGKEKSGYWWVWPLAVVLAILIFLGWYFSESGNVSATGNNSKISPAEAPIGYNLSP